MYTPVKAPLQFRQNISIPSINFLFLICGQSLTPTLAPKQPLIMFPFTVDETVFSRISYKWKHTVCPQASVFTQHDGFLRFILAVVCINSSFLFIAE